MEEFPVVRVKLIKGLPLLSKNPIVKPIDAVELIGKELSDMDRECVCVLHLSTSGDLLSMTFISIGSLDASLASPREVFKAAILANAASMILIHNHPSGRLTPSKQDIETTKRIKEVGNLMDITLLDHIIVGGNNKDFYSIRESGILPFERQVPKVAERDWVGESIKEPEKLCKR